MMKRMFPSAALCVLLAWAPSVSAQVHAGVALSALTPEGSTVLDVRAPDDAALGVRIRLAFTGQTAAAGLLDVWVAPSTGAAAEIFSRVASTTSSRVLSLRSDLGSVARADAAMGAAGLVVAQRDNIVFAVRSIDARMDAAVVARHIDAAIVASPLGSAIAERSPQRTETADATVFAMAGFLDVAVRAEGDGHPRRLASTWRIPHGDAATVFWVDAQLRVGSTQLAP